VVTETAGTPAARSLSLPSSSLGQLAQPLNKGCINNLVALASSNLNVALGDSTIRQIAPRTPTGGGGVKGIATRETRAAHAGPRAAAHLMALPAVYTCSLSRKAALKSEAAMTAMMTANVSCGRVSQAFLAILEPERKGWADSGVSQVTRGQGHLTKGLLLDGHNKCVRF
jgi:hypothetical protein